MSETWRGPAPPPARPLSPRDRLRVLRRALPLALTVFGGLALLLLVRLVERPLCGMDRPVTPWITRGVCRLALRLIGLRLERRGRPDRRAGAMVANHASWLDIFALNAGAAVYFVSKAEVAGWPGIGWLARATGTVFIRRDRREAAAQARLFAERLAHGHTLLFFPEGTSTDGRRVLPFKTTLFQAFLAEPLGARAAIQAVTVIYHAPPEADPALYGWWGEMDFAPHLVRVLATKRQGRVELVYHPRVDVAQCGDRKRLARRLEEQVRAAHPLGRRDA
ncbi:lyso-ornithine lipid O-acyltransferase [Roseivivax sp. CAU 1761]